MKKKAKMKRNANGKPIIDVIVLESEQDSVEWSIDDKEETEFAIAFPSGKDPLEPGPSESTNHKLTRSIKHSVPRGKKKHYPYKMKLIRTGENVEGSGGSEIKTTTPPDMIIQ